MRISVCAEFTEMHFQIFFIFKGDAESYNLIKNTIALFNTKSCVKFKPRQGNERDWVIFIKKVG